MLVITGASGMVGAPTIKALIAKGLSVRALTSSAVSAERLMSLGVSETVIGDFRKAEDLERVLIGADTVVHIPPSVAPDEDEIGFRMIAAAKACGVDHFIFLSCFHSQISDLRHHRNKIVVEDALIKSGLTYSILQPSMFMQNIGFIRQQIVDTGVFAWSWEPDRPYCMVDVDDLAAAIAVVATTARLRGGTYELCSDDTLTVGQMAERLSAAWGRPVRADRTDVDAWAAGMRAHGAPEWAIETVVGMSKFHDLHGYGGGNGFVLEALIGRKPTSYAAFAARLVQESYFDAA